MDILLYSDKTIEVDLVGVSSHITAIANLTVQTGTVEFSLGDLSVRYPNTYEKLSQSLRDEANGVDLAICATRIAYENNYFHQSSGKLVLLSFYAWEQLSPLPVENGLVYFIASLVKDGLPFPDSHEVTSGCINDFLWDKTAIDLGMRSGRICDICTSQLRTSKLTERQVELLDAVQLILRDLALASRNDQNIVDFWRRSGARPAQTRTRPLDSFLCHNSQDKPEVRKISAELQARGLTTWLDEEQLRPGLAWQVVLEEQIAEIGTAAVFVGDSGFGPWQDMEMRAFLSEFARRQCPVIPVILPGASQVPELPIFLRQLTWVDFRGDHESAMDRLVWGITGTRP